MVAETEPAESPPMSSVIAHETPTVHSKKNIARQENQTHVSEFEVRHATTMQRPERRKPVAPTARRAILRSPERLAHRSEIQPPSTSPAVPASKGRLA